MLTFTKTGSILALTMAAVFTLSGCMAMANSHMDDQSSMMSGDSMMSSSAMQSDNVPMVGGAPMYPSKTIVQNASQADNLTTLVTAVKAAGLVDTLSSPGPFTVFAPTNAAFKKLPDGTVQTLLKPANKAKLKAILTYHVLANEVTASEVISMIKANGGSVSVETVQGGELTFMWQDGHVVIEDARGRTAMVTQANVMQSNGVVHVIDTVLLPPK